MKKLIGFLIVAALVGCNCMSQLPLQIVYTGETCEAPLPDYRDRVPVRDNCDGWTLMQSPLPGTLLNAANPFVEVTLMATDFSSNTDKVEFDVVLMDTIPPVIEVDTSLFTYTAEQRSSLLTAYHTSLGKDLHRAAAGPDSLYDEDYGWFPNSWLDAGTMFDTYRMVIVTDPGFEGRSIGFWTPPERPYIMALDSSQLDSLGYHIFTTLHFIPPEPLPITINCGSSADAWFTQIEGGKYTNSNPDILEPYRSERFGIFSYRIPIGTGHFSVELHFEEIYFDVPGERVFSVEIEGKPIADLTGLDLVAEYGAYTPYVYESTVRVLDGWLDINFISIPDHDYPKISGIVVKSIPDGIISQL